MLYCIALLFAGSLLALIPALRRRHASSSWNWRPIAAARVDCTRNARKPEWVRREIIRLAAWSPGLSCRVLAEVFNRRFAIDRRMTVGKTYVATLLRQRHSEILRLRRTLKHRVPHPQPRAALILREITDKRSLTILRELIIAFRKYGLPHTLRVDNEACFSSLVVRGAMLSLGIRSQPIALHCPWMNGRIERLFGTLKRHLDFIAVTGSEDLASKLLWFRLWYNHVRPHQHLSGLTPAEAWTNRPKTYGAPVRFEAWDERLIGWYFQPP